MQHVALHCPALYSRKAPTCLPKALALGRPRPVGAHQASQKLQGPGNPLGPLSEHKAGPSLGVSDVGGCQGDSRIGIPPKFPQPGEAHFENHCYLECSTIYICLFPHNQIQLKRGRKPLSDGVPPRASPGGPGGKRAWDWWRCPGKDVSTRFLHQKLGRRGLSFSVDEADLLAS